MDCLLRLRPVHFAWSFPADGQGSFLQILLCFQNIFFHLRGSLHEKNVLLRTLGLFKNRKRCLSQKTKARELLLKQRYHEKP